MKLINGSIQLSYDNDGYKYDLPIFVISKPDEYIISNLPNEIKEDKIIELKVQYLNHLQIIQTNLLESIDQISQKVKEFIKTTCKEEDKDCQYILIYRGKIMKKENKIGNYIKDNDLIEVFKTNKFN